MLDFPKASYTACRLAPTFPSCVGSGRAGDRHVKITPFLTSRVFDEQHTAAMGVAFEKVCHTLGLAPKADPVTEHVAKAIIALAEVGERDPERLYAATLAQFNNLD